MIMQAFSKTRLLLILTVFGCWIVCSSALAETTQPLTAEQWAKIQGQLEAKQSAGKQNAGSFSGTASVTTSGSPRNDGYNEQAFLKASNAGVDDQFGVRLAINEAGTILVVGARYEESDGSSPSNNSIDDAGAAYIFERNRNGNWIETAYLKPSLPYLAGTVVGHQFGLRVAISGQTVVVGEQFRYDEPLTPGGPPVFNVGAVYVFEPDRNGNWVETEVLQSSNPNPEQDQFGGGLAISGDRLLIGATREDQPGIGINGAVRAYSRSPNGRWDEEDVLLPLNAPPSNMLFGWSIALDDDLAIIGAPFENSDGSAPDDESAPAAGAAYIFERDATGQWHEVAYLKASNAESDDFFGFAVGLSGPFAVVGAYGEDGDGSDPSDNSVGEAGAIYVFEPDGSGSWVQTHYLKAPNPSAISSLGWSLDLKGRSLVIGANREDTLRGSTYLVRRDNQDHWTFEQRLTASIRDIDDRFGHDVSQGGGRIVSSAWWESSNPMLGPDDNSFSRAGAVYLYDRDGFAVGGNVKDLVGHDLIVQLNGADELAIDINGEYTLPGRLADGASYNVSIAQQPINPAQFCSVGINGSGTINNADVSNISIVCTDTVNSEGLLEPSGIGFGSVLIDQTSAIEPLVFGNVGSADLIVDNVTLTGPAADQYNLILDQCSKTLLTPGQNCDISVRFQPNSTGLKLARLEVSSDDPDSPAIVSLNGIGVDEDTLFADSFE